QASRWFAHRAAQLSLGDGRSNGDRHRLGDLVLEREDVSQIAVVAFRPDMLSALGLDQLRGDPEPVAGLAQAALEHVPNAELTPDLRHIDRTGLMAQIPKHLRHTGAGTQLPHRTGVS